MKRRSKHLLYTAILGLLLSPAGGFAQVSDEVTDTKSTIPQLADEAFAPPRKSQDQQVDKRNTVPKDFKTHIILGDESDRPLADKILKLYKVFETNPSPETMEEFMSDRYIQHSAYVPNGRTPIAMLFASSVAQYDVKMEVHKVMVVGNWGMAHVNFRNLENNRPDDLGMAAVDIYLFGPDGRIEEHWDVLQEVPIKSANSNGMFLKHFQGE